MRVILKNKKGFSLVQTMIGLGLLGCLSLILWHIIDSSTKTESSLFAHLDFKGELNKLSLFLTNEQNCNVTLGISDTSPVSENVMANKVITEIKYGDGKTRLKVQDVINNKIKVNDFRVKILESFTSKKIVNTQFLITYTDPFTSRKAEHYIGIALEINKNHKAVKCVSSKVSSEQRQLSKKGLCKAIGWEWEKSNPGECTPGLDYANKVCKMTFGLSADWCVGNIPCCL